MNTITLRGFVAFIGVGLVALQACVAQAQVLAAADRLELQGRFREAVAQLESALREPGLSAEQRKQLEFERDRLERIKIDFPLTKEALFKQLKAAVRGLTVGEFDTWIAEGRFDSRSIDGAERFMVSSVGNLFWRHPELGPRRMPARDTTAYERRVLKSCAAIKLPP